MPTWGDGSGTGTRGTVETTGASYHQWMGTWLPTVIQNMSNWKELHTLSLTLEKVANDLELQCAVEGTVVFYFTDNMVTYYVVHSGSSWSSMLHAEVCKIKELELCLSN